jgi:hypothetical protein
MLTRGIIFFSAILAALLLFSGYSQAKGITEQSHLSVASNQIDSTSSSSTDDPSTEGLGKLKKVHFYIFVIDIDNIDGSNQSFSANFYVSLRWVDKRLAKDTPSVRLIDLDDIWSPRITIVNQNGKVWESLPRQAEVSSDGTVIYNQRYVGPLSQPLKLSNFPMDKQQFIIHMAPSGQDARSIELVPDIRNNTVGGNISDQLSLSDWEVTNHKAYSALYEPAAGIVGVPSFAFEFTAKRYFIYYLWQVILPLSLIVMMSMTVLWIERKNTGTQVGLAASSILALITYRFVIAKLLPILPYMTRMDYFTFGSTLIVFLALIKVVATAALERRSQQELGKKIDRFTQITLPALFLLLLGWFLSGL